MKPVTPPSDLPSSVKPVMFQPPEGMEDEINPLPGMVHLDDEGHPLGLEFMFELSKEEIQVLRHEPFVTITFMGDQVTPFALQTSYPIDEKYAKLMEHHHICTQNLVHEKQKFWRCDNPTHNSDEQKLRECDACFENRQDQEVEVISEEAEEAIE